MQTLQYIPDLFLASKSGLHQIRWLHEIWDQSRFVIAHNNARAIGILGCLWKLNISKDPAARMGSQQKTGISVAPSIPRGTLSSKNITRASDTVQRVNSYSTELQT